MKNTSHSSPTGSLLVGMAAGAALGAVGTMAAPPANWPKVPSTLSASWIKW